MKLVSRSLAFALLGAVILPATSATAALRLPRPSPGASTHQTIGVTDIDIAYSRPGVKNRVIWGGLVPFDKAWRTGANEPTTITFSTDVQVQGKPLKAGRYTFFTVPAAGPWTVVFSQDKIAWPNYEDKPEKSTLRVQVQPDSMPNEEWMRFSFENLTPTSGDLVLRWEKLHLAVPITTGTDQLVLANARREVASAPPNDWRTSYRAADYLFTAGIEPALAKQWADRSIAVQSNYSNLSLRARMYAKDGDTKQALASGQRAIRIGKASANKVDTSATEKLVTEWTAKP